MKCPRCGGDCEYPTVDIGVAEIQCGPAGCPDCHWVEGATPEEQAELDAELKASANARDSEAK